MNKRRLILLNKDRTVSMSKKTVEELRAKGKLNGVKWVLIPIQCTSSTYIAVSSDTILTQIFDHANIRFHLQLGYNTFSFDPYDDNRDSNVLYDYNTVTMNVETIEELYNALYNAMGYRFCRECAGVMEHPDYAAWYIGVLDMEVVQYKNGKIVDSFYVESEKNAADIPFDLRLDDVVCDTITSHFGLYASIDNRIAPTLAIRSYKGILQWEVTTSNVKMVSNLTHILIGVAFSSSFVVLTAKEYDSALIMNSLSSYISPIALDALSATEAKRYLAIAHTYDIPKYTFENVKVGNTMMYNCSEDFTESLFTDFTGSIPEIFSYDIYDPQDIIVYLEHLPFLLKMHHEGMKATLAAELNKDIMEMHMKCTVFVHMQVCLEFHPNHPSSSNSLLHMFTDAFEDSIPNIEEVCYLLHLLEKEE